MATTHLQSKPVQTVGSLPSQGDTAPAFSALKVELGEVSLADFAGKNVVLNVFPSVDTGVCAASVRRFNVEAGKLDNTVVLCISHDLPFALGRFCAAEGIENVQTLSVFRSDFGQKYGLTMKDGALAGLLARCVLIIDPAGKVKYVQLVDEITTEPDYEAALAQLA